VLRFLADELCKHLDSTLDSVMRAITHLRKKATAQDIDVISHGNHDYDF
jgi:hypothetical protein